MQFCSRFLPAAVILLATIIVVGLFNPMKFSIEAMQFEVEIDFLSPGATEISIPPLGSISATTHKTPVGIRLTLENIDIDYLGKIIADTKDQEQLIQLVQNQAVEVMRLYLFRLLVLALIGGLAGGLLLGYQRWNAYLRAGLGGLLIVAVLLGMTYGTYRVDNFHSPQFNGVLEAAPWMVDMAEKAVAQIQELSGRLQIMAENLDSMLEQLDQMEPAGNVDGDVKILHVSDIHNHPAAFGLIKQMVDSYDINFVVDTGDLSDYGTVLESLLTKELPKLSVPYVFIPGNHDSPILIDALEEYDNVMVLDEEVVEIDGVNIFGVADPASFSHHLISPSEEKYPNHTSDLKQLLSNLKVDIIAVHRPKLAHNLAGFAPIVLHGHDHRSKITTTKEAVIIDAGTTGGAGIRRLQALDDVPITLAVLHLNNGEGQKTWELSAVDMITIDDGTHRLSVERMLLSD